MLATWCAPRAPTLVSRLQICGGIVIQAAKRGNWAAVHSEHWGHTAAKRLVYHWNSSAMASTGPDHKTNGDGSPICSRKTRDEDDYTSIWPNASLTFEFTEVHWGLHRPLWAPPFTLDRLNWKLAPAFPSQLIQMVKAKIASTLDN